MAEEKMLMPNPKSAFIVLGILAIVYGIINYLITALGWQSYTAWIAGGAILLLVAWAKGSMKS